MSEAQRYWAYNRDLGETPEPGQIIVVTLEAHHAVVKALRDERDRLRSALEVAGDAICSEFCGSGPCHKKCLAVKAALTPAGGGKE